MPTSCQAFDPECERRAHRTLIRYAPQHIGFTAALLRNALTPVDSTIIRRALIIGFLIPRLAVHLFRYETILYSGKLNFAGTFRKRTDANPASKQPSTFEWKARSDRKEVT